MIFKDKKNIILFLFFSIYLIVGLTTYKDYGVGIEEHFQRKNGFYWLNYLVSFTNFTNFKLIVSEKLLLIDQLTQNLPLVETVPMYGIIFDATTAALEVIFKINDSKEYFEFRHLINFIIFFTSSIFFYKILSSRFTHFSISFLGTVFYILSPRIYGDSFHNNKDLLFLSLVTISIYYSLKSFEKLNYKNLIPFALFSAFSTSTRIIGIFLPVSFLLFYFFKYLSKKTNKEELVKFITTIILFLVFLFLHWPYLWSLSINEIFNFFDPFFSNYMHLKILFNGNYFFIKYLPESYLPIWMAISTPGLYIFLFFLGFAFLSKRIFLRLISIKEISISNDLWRSIKEKKDFYIYFNFLIIFIFAVFGDIALLSGWRHFYFLNIFVIYIGAVGIYFINIKLLSTNIKKVFFYVVIALFISEIIYKIYLYHPYQSMYFNNIVLDAKKSHFQVDAHSLSRSEALKDIIDLSKNKKKILVGTASWTPLENGKDMLNSKDREKIKVVGQNYSKAEFIYSNNLFEVDTKFNKKYDIPKNFVKIKELIVDKVVIYNIYKNKNL